jgi:hypothetical protein
MKALKEKPIGVMEPENSTEKLRHWGDVFPRLGSDRTTGIGIREGGEIGDEDGISKAEGDPNEGGCGIWFGDAGIAAFLENLRPILL